ncbi:hypothetical protein EXIGLDRAFT_729405 [Exidia glandulosa HHB12029]|uniref:Uncharacterized protein n=1 Tax=Exidia glandulosa HHB12029 TaxID=1314781 RepID=A0A165CKX7_EXIGL|nr:hypothetical protein EXIGLDRAFT_729405 [Exidia glandulosa HHB12029]
MRERVLQGGAGFLQLASYSLTQSNRDAQHSGRPSSRMQRKKTNHKSSREEVEMHTRLDRPQAQCIKVVTSLLVRDPARAPAFSPANDLLRPFE